MAITTAQLRHYRQSPRKVRLVADLVRGLDTKKAIQQLQFLAKRSARPIRKLIESAVANAEHNLSLDPDNLYIKSITVDQGPTQKRWRARAFGRAATIRKRTSHIKVVLEEKVPQAKKATKKSTPAEKSASKEGITAVKKRDELKTMRKSPHDSQSSATGPGIEQKTNASPKKGFAPKIFQRKAG